MDHTPHLIHATAVEVTGYGILLRGPSGSGKSDLALRLMAEGAILIADDQTELSREDNRLVARAPTSIQGMMEVRGIGLFQVPFVPFATVALVVDLIDPNSSDSPDVIERLPDPDGEMILGVLAPRIKLAAFQASASAKLRLWVSALYESLGTATQPGLTPACKISL